MIILVLNTMLAEQINISSNHWELLLEADSGCLKWDDGRGFGWLP